MNELRWRSIADLGRLLRSRALGTIELAESACDLLETAGRSYGAVAAVTRKRALSEARSAERAIASGTGGPLAGIPYGAKDLLAARGAPTTWGAPHLQDQVLDRDATAVARLRRSGAVLAAKLAMIELAGGGGYRFPSASLQGPCQNPWDRGRWAGGSSSGSGAAVAAGLVPFALGSETNGSIRTPAAYCGVTGLRPTYGLVSRTGAMALSWTLDKIGPLARSAEDCAVVLESLAAPDRSDRSNLGRRFRRLDATEAAAVRASVRVGYAGEELDHHASPEARTALAAGLSEFRRLVPRTLEARLPPFPYAALVNTIHMAEGATIFAELIESSQLDELADARQRAGLRASLEIPAHDYLQAMRLRSVVAERMKDLFRDVDVILSIGRQNTATRIDGAVDAIAPPAVPDAPRGNLDLVAAGNLAGLPAIFFPCGLGTDGLPVGLQLVGPPVSEPILIALVEAYQKETAHHLERPPTET